MRLFLAMLLLSCVRDARHASRPSKPAPQRVIVASRTLPAPPPVIAASGTTSVAVAASDLPSAAPVDPLAATRQAAHDVLAQHCGECHEGHRSNAPKALAVFDLDLPDWPSRFDAHRFESALKRLSSKPEPARSAFIAFRDAELAASPTRPH